MSEADHVYFGRVPEETLPVLALVARQLLEAMLPAGHPWQDQARRDFKVLAGDIPLAPQVDKARLDEVKASLKSGEVISAAPEAALLAFRVPAEAQRQTGNRLTAWVLAAALRRRISAPGENAIAAGLDAARLLKTRATAELDRLEPFPDEPEELLGRLDLLADDETLPRRVRRYFLRIAALVRAAHSERDPIFRDRGAAAARRIPPGAAETVEGVIEITDGLVPEDGTFAGSERTQQIDRAAEERAVRAADDPDSVAPRPVARRRAAKAARIAARRDLALSAEQDPLTPHEVGVLLQWLEDTHWNEPGHSTLLADLAYGAARERKRQGPLRHDPMTEWLSLSLLADFPVLDSPLEADDIDCDPSLTLPAPQALFKQPGEGGDANIAVKEILDGLRHKVARPLTRQRILRFKEDWLRRAGADQATIGYLANADPGGRAQMHYTVLPQAILLDWHHRYLEEALGMRAPRVGPDTEFYGPALRLPGDVLREVFKESRADLRRLRIAGAGDFEQIVAAHNAFAVYTLMVLYFASGHRPVTHPFEFRGDFDLETGLLWISDKEGRGGRGSRMVVLPAVAVTQVRHWVGHLERLEWRLSLTHPGLAASVRAALSLDTKERAPFLFLLDEDGRNVRPFRPSAQTRAMKPILPVALNWTRHVLRSSLAECCDPAALDAMMGHGHMGEEPFAPGTSLGLADLFRLSEQVGAILEAHSVKSVEGPL